MPPGKRPVPLSEELLRPPQVAALNVLQPGQVPGAVLLGATNNGMPLPVKNTFIDVPSGLTPSNMKLCRQAPSNLTAPADLNMPQGFLQKALVTSVTCNSGAVPPSPVAVSTALRLTPTSMATRLTPTASATRLTPTASATRLTPTASATRIILPNGQTPLATPSPMAAAAFKAWTANPKDAYSGASASTADTSAGGSMTSSAARLPPACSTTVIGPSSTALGAVITSTSPTATARLASPLGSMRLAQQQPLQLYQAISQTSPSMYGPPVMQANPGAGSVEVDEADESDEDSDDGGDQVQSSPRCPPADAPKPPPGAEHPSVGSAGHAAGVCKRCCFFPRGRCANGYTCEFCHYEHEKRKRKNKKKKKKECITSHSHVFHHHASNALSLPVSLRATQQLATVIEESPRLLSLQAGCSPRDPSAYMCQVVMPGYPQPQGQMMPPMLGHIVYGQTMCGPTQQGYMQAMCPQLQPQMPQAGNVHSCSHTCHRQGWLTSGYCKHPRSRPGYSSLRHLNRLGCDR